MVHRMLQCGQRSWMGPQWSASAAARLQVLPRASKAPCSVVSGRRLVRHMLRSQVLHPWLLVHPMPAVVGLSQSALDGRDQAGHHAPPALAMRPSKACHSAHIVMHA